MLLPSKVGEELWGKHSGRGERGEGKLNRGLAAPGGGAEKGAQKGRGDRFFNIPSET